LRKIFGRVTVGKGCGKKSESGWVYIGTGKIASFFLKTTKTVARFGWRNAIMVAVSNLKILKEIVSQFLLGVTRFLVVKVQIV